MKHNTTEKPQTHVASTESTRVENNGAFTQTNSRGPLGKRKSLIQLLTLAALGTLIGISWIVTNSQAGKVAPTQPYNKFASWPTLVQFARQEADKSDKDAVVKWVFARMPYQLDGPYSPLTAPLTLEFVYLRSDGEKFTIDLLDSDPPTVVHVGNPWPAGQEDPPTAEFMRQLTDKLSYIKLGPRQVYHLTEQEGIAFAKQTNLNVYPHLSFYLEHDWAGPFGVPTGWDMDYDGDRFHNPDKVPSKDLHNLTLRVDGVTGKILERELDFHVIKITTTPGGNQTPTTLPTLTRGP